MGSKLAILFALVAMFMDPCDKQPKNVELKDVAEACKTEVGRMYVRVKGRMRRTPDITCSDQPGGRRCEMFLATDAGEHTLPVLLRGTEKRDGQDRFESTLAGPKGVSRGSLEPYSMGFEDAQLYDRYGRPVDHVRRPVDLSGSLKLDQETGRCSLFVLHVEGDLDQ